MERLDAVAVIYRLASAVSTIAYPIRFLWYRAMPMDAAVALPDGRTLAIVRQGGTTDRTGFLQAAVAAHGGSSIQRRRSARARRGAAASRPQAAGRQLHHRRSLPWSGRRSPPRPKLIYGGWSSVNAAVSLRTALDRVDRGRGLPTERPLLRVSVPVDIREGGSGRDVPEHMLPALLKPAEKRTLDLLSDWPWISQGNLSGLLGVTSTGVRLVSSPFLENFGLVTRVVTSGRRLGPVRRRADVACPQGPRIRRGS